MSLASRHSSSWSLHSLPEGELGELSPSRNQNNSNIGINWLFSFFPMSGTSNLRDLVECLHELYDWKALGLYLNISYPKLQMIEMDHRRVADCKMAMLQHWLCSGTANKQTLLLALRKME